MTIYKKRAPVYVVIFFFLCLVFGFLTKKNVHLGLNFPVSPLWGAVLFGEGLELESVKGVFSASHILHGVLSPAALAESKKLVYLFDFTPKIIFRISI